MGQIVANPQPDKFMKISLELADAFYKIRIPGEARQVLDFIIRKTYGYNKKEDWISLSQFVDATGLKKPTVVRAIHKLISMNLVIRKDNVIQKDNAIIRKDNVSEKQENITYSLNKDYDTWKHLPKQAKRGRALSKKITTVIRKDNVSLSEKIPTIDNTTIDNTTKDNDIILLSVIINGSEYLLKKLRISISDYNEINQTHPGIDYANEAKKADLWLIDNPKKTKKNHRRYWDNWLENSKIFNKERGNGTGTYKTDLSKYDAFCG